MQRMRRLLRWWPLAAVAVATLAVGAMLAVRYPLWYDEALAFLLVTDGSLPRMLRALGHGVDGGFPLFYVLAWLWRHVVGPGEWGLRMFGSLGMAVAAALALGLLRRIFGVWAAAVGTLALFCTSRLILVHVAELRFYGLFMAVCAANLWYWQTLAPRRPIRRRTVLLCGLLQAALVLTHVLGLAYGVALLAALVIRDRLAGLSRPRLYLSAVCGWLALLLWLPALRGQMAVLRDDWWIPKPDLNALLTLCDFGIALLPLVVIGGALATILPLRISGGTGPETEAEGRSLLLLAAALLAVPLAGYLASKYVLARSVFLPRYYLPSALAWPIVIAAVWHRMRVTERRGGTALAGVIVALLVLYPFRELRYPNDFAQRIRAMEMDRGGADLPVVYAGDVEAALRFLPVRHYSREKERHYYLLDWEVASRTNARYMYRMTEALGRFYLPHNVVRTEEFLARHERFLLRGSETWHALRIAGDARYATVLLGRDGIQADVRLVTRGSGSAAEPEPARGMTGTEEP